MLCSVSVVAQYESFISGMVNSLL